MGSARAGAKWGTLCRNEKNVAHSFYEWNDFIIVFYDDYEPETKKWQEEMSEFLQISIFTSFS